MINVLYRNLPLTYLLLFFYLHLTYLLLTFNLPFNLPFTYILLTFTTDDMSCFCSIHCLTDGREFEDWIWDVQWLEGDREGSGDDDSSLALALGHNSVIKWQWRTDVILCHVHCEETCILYPLTSAQ